MTSLELLLSLAFIALLAAPAATATSIAPTRPVKTSPKRSPPVVVDRNNAITFLRKYGYLDDNIDRSLISESALSHAVSLFQEFYDLPIDGELNEETMRAMSKSRCGVRDIDTRHSNKEHVYKWPTNRLTWNFQFATRSDLQVAEAAFALWEANSSLIFTRTVHKPNIVISYKTGRHTMWNKRYSDDVCPYNLDGPGGVLAHAYFPNGDMEYISEIHIDNEETWHVELSENPWDRELLLHVLTHEIGHAIGIEHNPRNDSVMFAFEPFKAWPVVLSLEDVLAVQNRYGPKPGSPTLPVTTFVPPTIAPTTTTTTPQPPSSPPPPRKPKSIPQPRNVCEVRNPDVILLIHTITFVAQDKFVYIASANWGPLIYPRLLTDYLRFLPSNFTKLDAAYQQPSGELVLFADGYVYLASYPGLQLQKGWPRSFSDIGLPSDAIVNTAFQSPMGRTFIIFNNDSVAVIDDCHFRIKEYAKLQHIFPGVPPKMSLAFRNSDGNVYFLYAERYLAFSEFVNFMEKAGNFDMKIIDIHCPDRNMYYNLKSLVSRLEKYEHTLYSE